MKKSAIMSITVATALTAGAGWAQTTQETSGSQADTSAPAKQSDQQRTDQRTGDKDAKGSSMSAASGGVSADKKFVEDAARGGMAEVALGQLAAQKATSPEVKSLAQQMVDDHQKANDELKTVAAQVGVTLPTEVGAKDKAEESRLERLSGAEFDRAYVQSMVRDHEKDVAEFSKESKAGRDAAVKDWASKTLPQLQSHLEHAQSLAGSSAAGSAGRGPSTDQSSERQKTGGSR